MKRQRKEVCQLCSSSDSDQQQEGADEEGNERNGSHLLCAAGGDGGLQEWGDFVLGLLKSLGRNGSSASLGKDTAHAE